MVALNMYMSDDQIVGFNMFNQLSRVNIHLEET